ncbi:hypothetical protein GCM10027053_47680 [Intrasporangium mesophilum]
MSRTRREDDWAVGLRGMFSAGLGILITLTYLWDIADHSRLIGLIVMAVVFGFALAQVPPMKSLMHGRDRSRPQRTSTESPGEGTEGRP